jgi:dUTP pyrophosphatase
MIKLQIQFLNSLAQFPEYAHETDACFDLYCTSDVWISAGDSAKVPTGLAVAVPEGWAMLIYPRSGLAAKHGLRLSNCVGVIDAGYRDEVMVLIHNDSRSSYQIRAGDRIAQVMLVERPRVVFEAVRELGGEDRGGGFGSSGV